jgi:hypothetical protein
MKPSSDIEILKRSLDIGQVWSVGLREGRGESYGRRITTRNRLVPVPSSTVTRSNPA